MVDPINYQSNTRKEREKSTKKEKEEKNIEKVVTEDVVLKPRPIGRRFKEIFFGGDAHQAVKFVTADVLLPALRNLVVDMVTKGAERLIFGDSQARRRSPGVNYGARYQYPSSPNSYPFAARDRSPINIPLTPPSSIRQNRHEMNDIILASKEEAELVVERLNDILEKYDVASLADLYDLLGLETSHIDNKWGWTHLGSVMIRNVRQGFLLELPPLEEI